MRKLLMMWVLLLAGMAAQAQQAEVAEIRKLYAAAKQQMADRKKAQLPPNETVVNSDYMAPGAGPVKDVTHYFYYERPDQNLGTFDYIPYFITRKYNVGAREYYQEFLYDKEGNLMFFFWKGPEGETRYYLWSTGGGGSHKLVKGEELMDETYALRLSNDLCEAFHRLMNREY